MKRWFKLLGEAPPPAPKPDETRHGFTLVEILVVLVIIAILALLLFPLAKRMIEKGQSATCMSNLRQLGIAVQLFAGENRGFLPWAGDSSGPWEKKIQPYIGTNYKTWGRSKTWSKCGPYTCPTTAGNFWIGYGWNYDGLGMSPAKDPPDPGKTASDYTRGGPSLMAAKSKCVMIADTSFAYTNNPKSGSTPPESYNMIYRKSAGTPVPSPHSGGLNTLFVDCHIEWHAATNWYTNTVGRWP